MAELLPPFLQLIVTSLFGWTLLTVALSWILASTYPIFTRFLSKRSVKKSAFYTLQYGLLAPITATLALFILSLPNLSAPLVAEHCHGTACAPHTLQFTTHQVESVVIVTITILICVISMIFLLQEVIKQKRRLKCLALLSSSNPPNLSNTNTCRIIESPDNFAWCTGLLRPEIYVSSGLLQSTTQKQLQVILEHELTHAARKDNLRKWVLHWATIPWPGKLKKRIRSDLSLYIEQICDVAAANSENKEVSNAITNCCRQNQVSSHELQQRLAALERCEIDLSNKASDTIKMVGFSACVWATTVLLAVHFGHPVLEWVSR